MTRTYMVRIPYKASYPDPIFFTIGELLSVDERESDWKGWTWCRNQSGKGGWVPNAYMDRQGSTAVALQDYNAVELTVEQGELLTGGIEESGWLWCTKPSGISGWVPFEHLEKID